MRSFYFFLGKQVKICNGSVSIKGKLNMVQRSILNNKKGFTLIEVMIVIAIIGILAAIAIPNFLAYRAKGQDAAALQAAKNFYNMAMAYYADGHFGVVTESTLPNYNAGKEVDVEVTGSINNTAGGEITTNNLTFRHNASSNIHTLENNGDISSL
jgi:type IV pilus assembly protein PilA